MDISRKIGMLESIHQTNAELLHKASCSLKREETRKLEIRAMQILEEMSALKHQQENGVSEVVGLRSQSLIPRGRVLYSHLNIPEDELLTRVLVPEYNVLQDLYALAQQKNVPLGSSVKPIEETVRDVHTSFISTYQKRNMLYTVQNAITELQEYVEAFTPEDAVYFKNTLKHIDERILDVEDTLSKGGKLCVGIVDEEDYMKQKSFFSTQDISPKEVEKRALFEEYALLMYAHDKATHHGIRLETNVDPVLESVEKQMYFMTEK
ncbi:MAG: hypothetical protein ACMXYK_00705 [Candidatus Woesearchaeota archaeon]